MENTSLICDLEDISIDDEFLNNRHYIRLFLDEMMKVLEVKRCGRLRWHYLEENEATRGLVMVQLVKKGFIAVQIHEAWQSANIEILANRVFDCEKPLALIRQYFKPAVCNTELRKRL